MVERKTETKAVVKVMAEVGAGWLWVDGLGSTLEEVVVMSEEAFSLEKEFESWIEEYESAITPAEINHFFDWRSWNDEGLKLSRRLRRLLGNECELWYMYGYEDPNRPAVALVRVD